MTTRILTTILLLLALRAEAATFYVSQLGSGNGSGSDSGNCMSQVTWNGGQAAGSICKLVGAFTGPGGTYNAQVGFTANNQQIIFTPGSYIMAADTAQITTSTHNNCLIDGMGVGYIGCASNGTALQFQVDTSGIIITSSSNVTIQNLLITNEYVHTSTSDSPFSPGVTGGVYANGVYGTVLVQNCIFTNVCWCVNLQASYQTNLIRSNSFCGYDHGVAIGNSVGFGLTEVSSNLFGATTNWDTTANTYHHDGVHIYGGASDTNIIIRGNTFFGSWGNNNTAYIYYESNPSNTFCYNNLFEQYSGCLMNNGFLEITGNNNSFFNNTLVGQSVANQLGLYWGGSGSSVTNNIFLAVNTFSKNQVGTQYGSDYNIYANIGAGGNSAFYDLTTNYNSLALWQVGTGMDAHSTTNVPSLSGAYVPLSSDTVAHNAGVNLISYFANDVYGTARPSTGAWDIGAAQYVGYIPPVTNSGSQLIILINQ